MRVRDQSSHPAKKSTTATAILQLLFIVLATTTSVNAVLYNDGKPHSIESSLNEAITLKSSSTLTLPPGDYTIRSPAGSDAAIRLHMSSALNATGGDIIGADASENHDAKAAAGVIVGSASRATFYDGVTVRGGSHMGAASDDTSNIMIDSSRRTNEVIISVTNKATDDANKGQGGDALVSQYTGTNVTIHGGNFIAGKGSMKDGHSLHASYEGQIHIHGGTYYGSWMARDNGSIIVNGCLSRIGTRLVGRLENGHSVDVQLFEEGGGKVTVNSPEKCNGYRKKQPTSPAVRVRAMMGGVHHSLLGVVALMCLGFALL